MSDPATNLQGLLLVILTTLLGAVGLLMVLGLLIAWRKAIARRQALDAARNERATEAPPDIWAAAGERFSEGADPTEGPNPLDPPADPESPDDTDPDQDPADWWKRS